MVARLYCIMSAVDVDDSDWFTGVVRGCGTADISECSTVTNEPLSELHLTDVTGELCYCYGDLCNAAPRALVARMAVSYTVAVLSALAGARSLSQ